MGTADFEISIGMFAKREAFNFKNVKEFPPTAHPVAVASNWTGTSSEFISSAQEFPTPLASTAEIIHGFVLACIWLY